MIFSKSGAVWRVQTMPGLKPYFGMKGKSAEGKGIRVDLARGALKAGAWHRITCVWKKPVYELYVDGKLVQKSKKVLTPHPGGSINIGSYSGKSAFLKGRIDQIRLYNIARPPQEGDEKLPKE